MTVAFLPDRALIRIGGTDAGPFLQALITTDLDALPEGEAWPGALLTPQGKILFDFMIWREDGGFTLETAAGERDALIKRLTMYKLRAAVEIDADPDQGVTVVWGEETASESMRNGGVLDGRFARAGVDLFRIAGHQGDGPENTYHALRITHGIAQSGQDFTAQDAFPHDVLMDFNGGLSFRKGCYVGQEVVSRMQHRGTARRRVVTVTGASPLPPGGTEVTVGGKPVGALGTVAERTGLAIVRIDRAGEAIATGAAVLAGDVPVTLTLPVWSGLAFPTSSDEALA